MTNHFIKPLQSLPGIQRDGTSFDSNNYIDGQWCRFYRGRPKKIGGYRLLDGGNIEIIRTLYGVPQQGSIDCYLGRPSTISTLNITNNGVAGGAEIDHTPDGFVDSPNNLWNFDIYTVLGEESLTTYILAQAIPNLLDINNSTPSLIYGLNINQGSVADSPFILLDLTEEYGLSSGGFIVLPPFIFVYGNGGVIGWVQNIDVWPTLKNAVIANTKIVAAAQMDGGTPSLLFWSLNQVIRVVFVGGTTQFSAIPLRGTTSIIAQKSVVRYNSLYYWVGQDQFYVTNGERIAVLPNTLNKNYFFSQLNRTYANKIVGVLNSLWSEIWWFWPKGNATENTDVLIYNYEFNIWYDSVLGRASAIPASTLPYPLMSDTNTIPNPYLIVDGVATPTYGLWMHEYGLDQSQYNQQLAIPSYFTTNIQTLFSDNPQLDNQMRIFGVEADFVQTGNMTATVNSQVYANTAITESTAYTFGASPQSFQLAKTDMNEMGREVSFTFASNTQGGNYESGKILLKYGVGQQNQ